MLLLLLASSSAFLTFGAGLVTLDALRFVAIGQVAVGALVHTLPGHLHVLRPVQHPVATLGVGFAGQVGALLRTQAPPLHELQKRFKPKTA